VSVAALGASQARAKRNWSLWIGLLLLLGLAIVAIAGPWLIDSSALDVQLDRALLPPGSEAWFGTDDLGRDVLARVVVATRVDLQIALFCVLVPFVIGTTVGLVSGYVGGMVDTALMRLVDMLWAFPFYVLVIAIVGSLGPGIGNMYLAFALVAWISFARIVRGEVLLVKRFEYVQACRVLGYSHLRILAFHVLPNVVTPAIIFMMADVVLTILAVTSLGFLGLGIQPPMPEWGVMISEGRDFILDGWWISLFPGLAIAYVGVAFALLGDGLGDLLRPKA
jgi:peptide/nickel transport system permease protein